MIRNCLIFKHKEPLTQLACRISMHNNLVLMEVQIHSKSQCWWERIELELNRSLQLAVVNGSRLLINILDKFKDPLLAKATLLQLPDVQVKNNYVELKFTKGPKCRWEESVFQDKEWLKINWGWMSRLFNLEPDPTVSQALRSWSIIQESYSQARNLTLQLTEVSLSSAKLVLDK